MSQSEDLWNWVDLKVRKLVRDLMEPNLLKFSELELQHLKLTRFSNENRDRITSVQNKIDILAPKIPNLEPVYRKFNEFSIKFNSLDYETNKQIESLNNQLDKISSRVGDIGSKFLVQAKQSEQLFQNLAENSKTGSNLRIFIEEQVKEVQRQITEPFNLQAETNISFQSQFKGIESRIQSLSEDFNSFDFSVKKNEHDLKSVVEILDQKINNLVKPLTFYENEVKGIRSLITFTQDKLKTQIETGNKDLLSFINNKIQEFGKNQQSNLTEVLDFVLKEPRYRKKLSQLKKMNTLKVTRQEPQELRRFTETDIFPPENDFETILIDKARKFRKAKDTASKDIIKEKIMESNLNSDSLVIPDTIHFNKEPAFINNELLQNENEKLFISITEGHNDESSLSTNETQKTLEARQKFTFSGTGSKVNDSDLESISEECSEGRASSYCDKVIEELKSELKTLNQKQESLSTELKASTSRSSIKINSLRFCLILMKHQNQKALQVLKDSLESSLKSWTQSHVSTSLSSFTKKIEEDTNKALEDSKKIIENSQVLEMLIKNTTYEFGSYLSGKKRETSDTKLEISRIYKKFETISKKQTIQAGILEKIQDFIKESNNLMPNEQKVPGLAIKAMNTPKSQFISNEKNEIFNTEKDSSEIESPTGKSNFSYSRSQTPELPNIYRARP